jgi:hypothetical protein
MTVLDRVVRWNLDLDGSDDIYGDERERLRWYEGIATAASLQWLAIPWAAAIMVWPLGRASVLPLTVVLAALILPMIVCTVYVQRSRVVTDVRAWTAKRIFLQVVAGLPYVIFFYGVLYSYGGPESSTLRGAIVGSVIGAAGGIVATIVGTRRKRRQEARAAAAGDED